MGSQEIENEIFDGLKSLSQDSLRQAKLFIQFLQLRERLEQSPNHITNELFLLDKRELLHLEQEFKDYREIYPHEE